jgi:gas vesicle protein
MAYHLIPFVIGAAVGGLAVYLYREEKAVDNLRRSAEKFSRKAQQTAGEVSGKVTDRFSRTESSTNGDNATAQSASEPRDTVREDAADAQQREETASSSVPPEETEDRNR